MRKLIKKSFHKYLGLEIRRVGNKSEFEKIYDKYSSFSMIPKESYIANLEIALPYKYSNGDIIECGVWKGGMIAGIAEILGNTRHYHLFDSFEGLPDVKDIDGESAQKWQMDKESDYYYDNCRAEEEYSIQLFENLKVNYSIHKGWFENTFPAFQPQNTIDILRLDADWYESTILCLQKFYPYVRKGGLIIIDDYYTWDGCSIAVHKYLSDIQSKSRIYSGTGFAYIIKQ